MTAAGQATCRRGPSRCILHAADAASCQRAVDDDGLDQQYEVHVDLMIMQHAACIYSRLCVLFCVAADD
jgi:hypothetical protein